VVSQWWTHSVDKNMMDQFNWVQKPKKVKNDCFNLIFLPILLGIIAKIVNGENFAVYILLYNR